MLFAGSGLTSMNPAARRVSRGFITQKTKSDSQRDPFLTSLNQLQAGSLLTKSLPLAVPALNGGERPKLRDIRYIPYLNEDRPCTTTCRPYQVR